MKNILLKLNKKNTGFTLVETLVSLSIFSVSVILFMSVLGSGITDTNYAKQKIVAGYLAQEGIEYMRNMRDNNVLYDPMGPQHGWDTFKTLSMNYPVTNPDLSNFTRTTSIDISNFGTNEVKITSTVSWRQGSGVYSVVFSENLFNW